MQRVQRLVRWLTAWPRTFYNALSVVVAFLQRWAPATATSTLSRLGVPATAKRYVVHVAFFALAAGIAWHSQQALGSSRSSLLYTLVAGDEVVEGPLDPSAYAQTDAPGVGGARIAAVDGQMGVDIITFEDAEVNFAAALGGTSVVAPLHPVEADESDLVNEDRPSPSSIPAADIYTVEDGDTIAGIAEKFDISTETILWANGLSSSTVLKVGDHVTILPTTGVLHTVRSGDTLLAVADKYEVDALKIKAYNHLEDSGKLSIGQKLIVPDGSIAPATAPQIVPRDTRIADRDAADGPTPEPQISEGRGMVWPTSSRHLSQYFRWGHTGIDIDNRARPPIYAAQAGTVEFAGRLGGYGNLIIVNHGGGLQTYYGHLDKFYVNDGATVAKGAAIGKMGSTGRSTGPHLHFEVRRGGQPVNPLGMY